MRKLLSLVILLTVFCGCKEDGTSTSDDTSNDNKTTKSNWTVLSSPTTKSLTSVYFTDINTGYIVGQDGYIAKTTNGGTTWATLSSGTTNRLTSIYFTDANTGYIVGWGGIILKTTDAGITWAKLSAQGLNANFYSVFFSDSNNGYIGMGNYLCKTSNAGKMWYYGNFLNLETGENGSTYIGAQDIYSICFIDNKTGYVVGSNCEIWKSTQGGVNWKVVKSYSYDHFTSVYFTDLNNGYAVGWAGGGHGAIIVKTTDGGLTWKAFVSNSKNELSVNGIDLISCLNSVYFTDAKTGYIVGLNGIILETNDSGINWNYVSSGTENSLSSVFFPSPQIGYAVGYSGTILKFKK